MALIRERKGRHFLDENGRMFWINGPDDACYLSEQRQWREGLTLLEVVEWKQCSPTGKVSQKFQSVIEVCKAYEQNTIFWKSDDHLRRMGDEMERHRSTSNYRPTYMKMAELEGSPIRVPPWIEESEENQSLITFKAPRCLWPGPKQSKWIVDINKELE